MSATVMPGWHVNADAEHVVLGCALMTTEAARWLMTHGREEWFFLPQCKATYRAMKKLHRAGLRLDILLVQDQLKADQASEPTDAAIVDQDFLLYAVECVPSPTNYADYGQVVSMYWRKREMVNRLDAMRAELLGDCGPAEIERIITRSRQLPAGLEWYGDSTIYLPDVDLSANTGLGMATGFEQIDKRTSCGGLPHGSVTLIVAPRKGGKTSFALQIFREIALYESAAFVTLEMSPEQLKRGLMRQSCGMWRTPNADNPELITDEIDGKVSKAATWNSALASLDTMTDSPIHSPRGDERTVESVCAWIEDRHRTKPVSVYVIDYAQKLHSANSRRWAGNRVAELEFVSGLITATAATIGKPILLLAQSADQAAKDAMEITTKGSRAFEQDCALMICLARTGEKVSAAIKANRYGQSDVELQFQWDKRLTTFVENGQFENGRWVTA